MKPVDQLKEEYETIAKYLTETNQISLLSDLNKSFRKILLLSAGSYFEYEITTVLSDYVAKATNGDERLINFLQKQAISGKYFQLFDWGKQDEPDKFGDNANKFWSFFGANFKIQISAEIKSDISISKSISAFLQIGHLRNILVHSNFAAYNYEQKTTDEIYELYTEAVPFIDYLKQKFN